MNWMSFMNSDPKLALNSLETVAEYRPGGPGDPQSARYFNLVCMLSQRHVVDAASIATQHSEIRWALLADCQQAMAELQELEVPPEQWETRPVARAIARRMLDLIGLSREEPGRRIAAAKAVAARRPPRRRSRARSAGSLRARRDDGN